MLKRKGPARRDFVTIPLKSNPIFQARVEPAVYIFLHDDKPQIHLMPSQSGHGHLNEAKRVNFMNNRKREDTSWIDMAGEILWGKTLLGFSFCTGQLHQQLELTEPDTTDSNYKKHMEEYLSKIRQRLEIGKLPINNHLLIKEWKAALNRGYNLSLNLTYEPSDTELVKSELYLYVTNNTLEYKAINKEGKSEKRIIHNNCQCIDTIKANLIKSTGRKLFLEQKMALFDATAKSGFILNNRFMLFTSTGSYEKASPEQLKQLKTQVGLNSSSIPKKSRKLLDSILETIEAISANKIPAKMHTKCNSLPAPLLQHYPQHANNSEYKVPTSCTTPMASYKAALLKNADEYLSPMKENQTSPSTSPEPWLGKSPEALGFEFKFFKMDHPITEIAEEKARSQESAFTPYVAPIPLTT